MQEFVSFVLFASSACHWVCVFAGVLRRFLALEGRVSTGVDDIADGSDAASFLERLASGDKVGFLGIGTGLNCIFLGLEW